jgi:hypothetical protein
VCAVLYAVFFTYAHRFKNLHRKHHDEPGRAPSKRHSRIAQNSFATVPLFYSHTHRLSFFQSYPKTSAHPPFMRHCGSLNARHGPFAQQQTRANWKDNIMTVQPSSFVYQRRHTLQYTSSCHVLHALRRIDTNSKKTTCPGRPPLAQKNVIAARDWNVVGVNVSLCPPSTFHVLVTVVHCTRFTAGLLNDLNSLPSHFRLRQACQGRPLQLFTLFTARLHVNWHTESAARFVPDARLDSYHHHPSHSWFPGFTN